VATGYASTGSSGSQSGGLTSGSSGGGTRAGAGGGGAKYFGGKGTSVARQQAAAAYGSLRALQAMARATIAQQRAQLYQMTRPGSGLIAVTLGEPRFDRQVSQAQFALDRARAPSRAAQRASMHAGEGDSTGAKLARNRVTRAEKKLAKAEAKRDATAVTVFAASYGLNSPILAGSRDDPRGALRPKWIHTGRYL
jgi:hypothetical protein